MSGKPHSSIQALDRNRALSLVSRDFLSGQNHQPDDFQAVSFTNVAVFIDGNISMTGR